MTRFEVKDRVTIWGGYSRYPMGFSVVRFVHRTYIELANETRWKMDGAFMGSNDDSKSYITPAKEQDEELYNRGVYILTLALNCNRMTLETKTTEELEAAVKALHLEPKKLKYGY